MAFDLDDEELEATRKLNGVALSEEEIIDVLENVFIWKNTNDKFTRLDLNAIKGLLDLYNQEKEKNKKLEEVINNLAKAIKFMGTNKELKTEDIIKMFSPEEIKMDFDDFMKRWEGKQHEEAKLKEKVIDMMAKEIANYDPNVTIDQIKEYYFKKAREE